MPRARAIPDERECVICGRSFTTTHYAKKTCGEECHNELRDRDSMARASRAKAVLRYMEAEAPKALAEIEIRIARLKAERGVG